MALLRSQRQAITHRGVVRRLRDLSFKAVTDPRKGATYALGGVLQFVVMCLASCGNSQRAIETRSEQLRPELRSVFGLVERIADNTIGRLLRRLSPTQLRDCLHAAVKAEHRRGRLDPIVGKRGVAAIDGKVLSTVREFTMVSACRAVLAQRKDRRVEDPDFRPDRAEIRRIFAEHFPWVQLVEPAGQTMHGLIRMHRTTLVSSDAAVCLDERPVAGSSNEVGTIRETFSELSCAYSRTSLFNLVTADAGNTSKAFAADVVAAGSDYFLCIKEPQGGIYTEATRVLEKPQRRAQFSHSEERSGQTVAWSVWVHPLPGGWIDGWGHARCVVHVERVAASDDGEPSVGNRYFVSSIDVDELTAADALRVCRWHWRCENENHWTADVVFREDARQTPLSRHPVGMLVASLLRMMALNILAVLRALTRRGAKRIKPTWLEAGQHLLTVVFLPTLDAKEFDAVA